MGRLIVCFLAATVFVGACTPDIAGIVREELEKQKEDKVVVVQQPPVTNTNEIINNPLIVNEPKNVNTNDQTSKQGQKTNTSQNSDQASSNTSTNVNVPTAVSNSSSESSSGGEVVVIPSSVPTASPTSTPKPEPKATPVAVVVPRWSKIQIPIPSNQKIYAVDCVSMQECWAVGGGGIIRHTVNSGGSWEELDKGTQALRSVSFSDKNNGWISGSSGTLYQTTNGKDFTLVDSTVTSPYIYGVSFSSPNTGLFINGGGSVGGIYDTQDGSTFTNKQALNRINGGKIFRFGSNKAIILTSNQYAVYLYDNGVVTEISEAGSALASMVTYADSNTGWLYGGSKLMKTTDGGKSFAEIDKIATEDEFVAAGLINGFAFAGDEGLMLRYNHQMYSTDDKGVTWKQTTVKPPFNGVSYFELFEDVNHGWALSEGHLYRLSL